jgi:hypothetical protein
MSKALIKFKLILNDQIWLIILIMPLIFFATLGLVAYKKNHENAYKNNNKELLSEVQLSKASLTKIVTKPLSELVLIKVYFLDEGSIKNALVAAGSTEENVTWAVANAILPNLPRRNRVLVLTYVSTCSSRRNQAVTG